MNGRATTVLPLAVAALLLAALAGCQEGQRFRSRVLGEVDMPIAMAAAQNVLVQYFTIAEVDSDSGRITSQPKAVRDESIGLVSRASWRELAVLRLRRQGRAVWADVSVIVQRQQGPQMRIMSPLTSRHDTFSPSPAQEDAPYTRQQQEAWQTIRHNDGTEARILEDLYNALHPKEGT